jgi:hypothetical protein
MTLATAFAFHDNGGTRLVAAFSDSRLSLARADSRSTSDYALKSIGLGPRSALLMAGDTVLPTVAAAEIARAMIVNSNVNRREEGKIDISLLAEVAIFLGAFGACCKPFKMANVQVLLTGFHSDGVPGIVRVELADGKFNIGVHRPPRGGFCVASIGDTYYASIATKAVVDALAIRSNVNQVLSRTASTFWDIMQHQGAPGIGGGLSFGWCIAGHSIWQWDPVRIVDQLFHRGLPMSEVPKEWEPSVLHLDHDPEFFAKVEQSNMKSQFPTQYPPPLVLGTSFAVDENEWPVDADEIRFLSLVDD